MTILRPSFLRTTFQLLGPSTVTDSVVPCRAGWSVPSATMVSTAPGPKVRTYLFWPRASTFISSVSLLLDGLTFHLPRKGSSAALNVIVIRQVSSTECFIRMRNGNRRRRAWSLEMLWDGSGCCEAVRWLGGKWLAGESACPTLKRVSNPLQDGILPHLLQLDG